MKLGLDKMINQIRRLWADKGEKDVDFTVQETKLHTALQHLKKAADDLSRASEVLIEVIKERGA